MMAPSHVAVGLAAWVVAAPILREPVLAPLPLALVALGALLPDIDHPSSWVGRRLRPFSTAVAAVLGHRGVTHSLVAVAVLAVTLLQFRTRHQWVLPLAVGYASHLGADMLTPRGLRLFWPMRRSWGVPLCATGSPAEGVVVALLLGLAWWSWTHPPAARLPRGEAAGRVRLLVPPRRPATVAVPGAVPRRMPLAAGPRPAPPDA